MLASFLLMVATDPSRIPPPPVKPATYTIVGATPAGATQVIVHAMHDAPPLPCPVTFYVEPTPGVAAYTASTVSRGIEVDCSIHIGLDTFRADNLPGAMSDHWWYADETVRHEIAHVLTPAEPGHGPAWRAYLNYMLRPLGLHETMDPDNGATVRMWHNGQCIAGCPVPTTTTTIVAPKPTLTVLEAATAMVGTSPAYAADGFWCTTWLNDILRQTGYPELQDPNTSPSGLRARMASVTDPRPGDVIFIDLMPQMHTGQTSHVGIIEKVNDDGSFETIEGNGSDSQHVARGHRGADEVTGFARAS